MSSPTTGACGVLLVCLGLSVATPAAAQQTVSMKRDLLVDLDLGSSAELQKLGLDGTNGAFEDDDAPLGLLAKTLGQHRGGIQLGAKDFYCIIHVVKWTTTVEVAETTIEPYDTVGAQHWYIYRGGRGWEFSDFTGTRVWGERDNVYFLYVHLDHRFGEYTPAYEIGVKAKTPANEQALVDILKLLGAKVPGISPAAAPGGKDFPDWPKGKSYWGFAKIQPQGSWRAADITIKSAVKTADGTLKKLDADRVIDNEGTYQWDVAAGVPIVRASELKNEAGQLMPNEIDKAKLFAMLKFYVAPVDAKTTGLVRVPNLFIALDVANPHPIDRLAVGVGWGPAFANMFVGAQRTKTEGHGVRWSPVFGLSLGARQLTQMLNRR